MSNPAQNPKVQISTKKQTIKSRRRPTIIAFIDLTNLDDSDTETEDVNNMQRAGGTKATNKNEWNEEENEKSTSTSNEGESSEDYTSSEEQEEVEYEQELQEEEEIIEVEPDFQETENFVDSDYDYEDLELEYSSSEPDSDPPLSKLLPSYRDSPSPRLYY